MRSSRAATQKKRTKSKQKSTQALARPEINHKPTAPVVSTPDTQIRQPETTNASQESNLLTNILRLLALCGVIAISVYIFSIRERVAEFKQYGYLGIFFIALLANATVLLPAPGVAIIYAMGAVFNPLWVGIWAGTGGAIGELSGYLAGFSGQAIVERTDVYHRVKPWVEKYGGWAIVFFSAIPNPFFDVAGIAAGIVKMPMRTFLFSVWIGQLIKMTLFAYAGMHSIKLFTTFIK